MVVGIVVVFINLICVFINKNMSVEVISFRSAYLSINELVDYSLDIKLVKVLFFIEDYMFKK